MVEENVSLIRIYVCIECLFYRGLLNAVGFIHQKSFSYFVFPKTKWSK